jgi:CDP-glucose 4,6-dehydratase
MDRTDLEPVILDQVRAEIKDQYLDSTRARRVLGWTARHTLAQGLDKTIAWYRQFFSNAAGTPAAGEAAARTTAARA